MVQLTPNNHHHSESTWSICYDSAYYNCVCDQCQNAISLPGCMEPWLLPLFIKLWLIICKKKITFGTLKQTYVDKKRRLTLNASSFGGQVKNLFAHLQQWLSWHPLENIWNIGPVPTCPWHHLAPVTPTDCLLFFWYALTKLLLKLLMSVFLTMWMDGQSQMTGWPFRSTGGPIGHPVNMLGEALGSGEFGLGISGEGS